MTNSISINTRSLTQQDAVLLASPSLPRTKVAGLPQDNHLLAGQARSTLDLPGFTLPSWDYVFEL